MTTRHFTLIVGLAAAIAACSSWSAGGIISVPYWNDFSVDADDFSTLGTWTLDTSNQVYNTTISAASTESRALVTASDLGGSPTTAKSFWMSSDFTINQLSGGSPATIGLRALSTYTADIQEGGGMRIWGGSLNTNVIGTFPGGLQTDTLYTMSLLGTYYGDKLTLEFSVTDGTLTTSVSREGIASPATGQDFGLRNRTSSTYSQPLDVDFHNFTLIPEPSSFLLAVLGLTVLVPARRRRVRFSSCRGTRDAKVCREK